MKMNKKKVCKVLIPVMASTIVLAPIAPSIQAFAASPTTTVNSVTTVDSTFENTLTPSTEELKNLGLSNAEIKKLLSVKSSEIYLNNGIAYDKNGKELIFKEGKQSEVTIEGKLSWAVKALKAAWVKLPTNIQVAIGGTTGFATLLNFIDNFTGAIEDAVYAGCKTLGMSDTVAWWVTKTLMLFL